MEQELRRRVAVIVPKYGLVGGAESFVAELTSRLAHSNFYDVNVFANKWLQDESLRYYKVPILSFPRFLTTISFAYFAGCRMRKEAIETPFDLIHTHDRIFHADLFTMHSIPHRLWVKEVRRKRTSLFDIATAWVEWKLVKNGTCRFVAVSELTKEKFLQEYPSVQSKAVSVIHPGIDPQTYSNLNRLSCRAEIRKIQGIEEEDFVLLFVSMNFDIKGLDFVLRGLVKVQKAVPEKKWKLLVAGKDDYRKYDKMARTLGIRDRLIFVGVINRNALKQYYLASDAFIMPSRFDTFGMTVLEAMAAGLPVIVSRNVGAKDIIDQDRNGFVVKNADMPDEIARAILTVMDNKVRARIGEEAQKTAVLYSWDNAARKTAALYESILAERYYKFSKAKV